MDVRILLSAKQTADHSHIEGREGGREEGGWGGERESNIRPIREKEKKK